MHEIFLTPSNSRRLPVVEMVWWAGLVKRLPEYQETGKHVRPESRPYVKYSAETSSLSKSYPWSWCNEQTPGNNLILRTPWRRLYRRVNRIEILQPGQTASWIMGRLAQAPRGAPYSVRNIRTTPQRITLAAAMSDHFVKIHKATGHPKNEPSKHP